MPISAGPIASWSSQMTHTTGTILGNAYSDGSKKFLLVGGHASRNDMFPLHGATWFLASPGNSALAVTMTSQAETG